MEAHPRETVPTVLFAQMARYIQEGTAALQKRRSDVAVVLFERAVETALQGDLGPDVVAGTLRNLAQAHRETGHDDRALAAYNRALETTGITDLHKAAILHGIGILHCRAGSYTEAQDALERSFCLWNSTGDLTARARVGLLLARTQRLAGQWEQAEGLVREVLQDLSAVDPTDVPFFHLEAARITEKRGDLARCRQHLAAAASHDGADPSFMAEYRLVQARLQLADRNLVEALEACADAMDLALRDALWDDLQDAHAFMQVLLKRREADG